MDAHELIALESEAAFVVLSSFGNFTLIDLQGGIDSKTASGFAYCGIVGFRDGVVRMAGEPDIGRLSTMARASLTAAQRFLDKERPVVAGSAAERLQTLKQLRGRRVEVGDLIPWRTVLRRLVKGQPVPSELGFTALDILRKISSLETERNVLRKELANLRGRPPKKMDLDFLCKLYEMPDPRSNLLAS